MALRRVTKAGFDHFRFDSDKARACRGSRFSMESELPNPLDALFLQKQYHYRGCAKISLHNLKFEDENVAGGRTVDPKNIARLIEVFESEGCLRLEAENHIPALIGETPLGDCLRNSSVSQAALLDFRQDPPFLHLADGQCLVALHGKHRIKAAENFLEPFDRWWVVDLYNSSESPAGLLLPALTAVQIFRRSQCLTYARSTPMRAASVMETYFDTFVIINLRETSPKPADGKPGLLHASFET